MNKTQLTETAENIVNQIISSDAVTVSYGPVAGLLIYAGDIDMSDEGVIMNTDENSDVGVPFITNDNLNNAKIIDGNIVIPIETVHYWNITISLHKLKQIAAIN